MILRISFVMTLRISFVWRLASAFRRTALGVFSSCSSFIEDSGKKFFAFVLVL